MNSQLLIGFNKGQTNLLNVIFHILMEFCGIASIKSSTWVG